MEVKDVQDSLEILQESNFVAEKKVGKVKVFSGVEVVLLEEPQRRHPVRVSVVKGEGKLEKKPAFPLRYDLTYFQRHTFFLQVRDDSNIVASIGIIATLSSLVFLLS